MAQARELWKSRIGLVLATAGNAIGLGNFLRFPVQCAKNGGGAFMVPYLAALLLFGIPLMWCEWAMGRHGGVKGHGTTPGIFYHLWHNRLSKYIGTLGILITFGVGIYYVYVMSWTLAYSFFSLTGKYMGITSQLEMSQFLSSFQGVSTGAWSYLTSLFTGQTWTPYFKGLDVAYVFYLISLALVIYILSKGVVKGLERLAKIGMPILFIFGIILVVRIFTLGTPDPAIPENSINAGLGFMWNPDFAALKNPEVWLAAAGQVFFTLSVGFGAIQTYASYIKKKDDVALNGLSTASTNSFAEIILGGSIAIPIAVAFFGLAGTEVIAKGGAFNLGFAAMPLIFQKIPLGQVFGTLWFFLLFVAGITSSVAITQPFMAFLQDEFQLKRRTATIITGSTLFVLGQPVIFFLKYGFLDNMDFWLGTFGVTLFACLEVVIFVWLFGPRKAWRELTMGADMKVPRIFYYILMLITPTLLFVLLGFWVWDRAVGVPFFDFWRTFQLSSLFELDFWGGIFKNFLLKGVDEQNRPYAYGVLGMLFAMLLTLCLSVKWSFSKARLEKRGVVRE